MKTPANFHFFVEDDKLSVRFVSQRALGRIGSGQRTGGDFSDSLIRLARWETTRGQRAALLHELGHYLVQRQELRANDTTEEEVCDVLTWLPSILVDARNEVLRAFLGLELGG